MARHALTATRKSYWEDNTAYVANLGNNAAFARQVELFSSQNVTTLPPRATEGREVSMQLAAVSLARQYPQLTEEDIGPSSVRMEIAAQEDDTLDRSFIAEVESYTSRGPDETKSAPSEDSVHYNYKGRVFQTGPFASPYVH
ncbi:MAG TPA: hypothetical protein DCY07_03240 [Rhodospirillaceae bacterium]|nr:hypothetical protein [Rhodospirillaceae bacterium]